MNAPELLATVRARGATARAEVDATGAAVLVVAPRAVVHDLLPQLQRFKPQLIELLSVSIRESVGGHSEAETGQISPLASLVDTERQADVSGPQRPILAVYDLAVYDADARRRARPDLARRMQPRDVLELGRLLLALDAGEEIE